MNKTSADHQSRQDTERAGVDTLRQQGIPADAARKIAREASEQVHRGLDSRHTDRRSSR